MVKNIENPVRYLNTYLYKKGNFLPREYYFDGIETVRIQDGAVFTGAYNPEVAEQRDSTSSRYCREKESGYLMNKVYFKESKVESVPR